MNEYQRMQYLEAMGVDTFVPRLHLVNAKPSLQCEFTTLPKASAISAEQPLTNLQGQADPETEFSSETVRSLNEGLSDVLSELSLTTKPSNTPSNTLKSASTNSSSRAGADLDDPLGARKATGSDDITSAKPAGAELQATTVDTPEVKAAFNLALWFTDTGFQVIDSREDNDALPTDALLSNILIMHGLLNTKLAAAEIQRWPIPGSTSTDQSWHAASSMLLEFLSFRFSQKKPTGFLIFGESAYKAVVNQDDSFESQVYQTIEMSAFSSRALILPALRDFLYEPNSKRALWASINAFRSA